MADGTLDELREQAAGTGVARTRVGAGTNVAAGTGVAARPGGGRDRGGRSARVARAQTWGTRWQRCLDRHTGGGCGFEGKASFLACFCRTFQL